MYPTQSFRTVVKPHDQVSLDKFSLDKKPCSKAGHASFWTRKIVRVYTTGKETLSIQATANIVLKEDLSSRTHELTKLIKEKLRRKNLFIVHTSK